MGVNPCVENGYYYPVKPMSYFCPIACGCRARDKHCTDRCPSRLNNSDSEFVDYSGLDPNPSPYNEPGYPWRYSAQTEAERRAAAGAPHAHSHPTHGDLVEAGSSASNVSQATHLVDADAAAHLQPDGRT